jgi:hypothetical protein
MYMPARVAEKSGPEPLTSPGLFRRSLARVSRGMVGRLVSSPGLPHILLKVNGTTGSRDEEKELLVFYAPEITAGMHTAPVFLQYETLPDYVRSRIREPLAFISRRRLAYLDDDKWICTFRLPAHKTVQPSTMDTTLSSGHESMGIATDMPTRLENKGAQRQDQQEAFCTASRFPLPAYGEEDVERHYFLPGDWAMTNEAHLVTMSSDGTLLCPQNGGIATVQSATLRK